MLKYKPEELQKAIMLCISSELIPNLQKFCVNPKTISEIFLFERYAILKISQKYYAAVTSLCAGYGGEGPSTLIELLQWCGCDDQGIFDAIRHKNLIHLKCKDTGYWHLFEHEIKGFEIIRVQGKKKCFI